MTKSVSKKIEEFFAPYRLRQYTRGQILMLGGDKANYIYYLVKGQVKVYDITYRGDEVVLNIFKPPAFFPMSLAMNGGANPYIYEAQTNIELRQAPSRDVLTFVKTNPDVLFDLLSRVYGGLDGMMGRMVHLMASNAQKRLIYELVIEAVRFGAKDVNGQYMLAIHEKDLGARAGLSRETVSRELQKLKKEKLVEVYAKGIFIKDLAGLEEKIRSEV